jgi:AraC-like DNA-binding protein
MQFSLARTASAEEATTDHPPQRVSFVTGTEPESGCGQNSSSQEPSLAVRRAGLVIQHMERHLNEPLRISTLAALAGLSPSQFFFSFKAVTGVSPIAFLIDLRIRRACELLQDPQSSIKKAAELVGYSDRYYFTRMFKQVMGVPPGEYRRTLLGSSERTPRSAPSNGGPGVQCLPSAAFVFATRNPSFEARPKITP